MVLFAMAMPLALLSGRHQGQRLQARIDDLDALTGGERASRHVRERA
jgi:hypothetical protein